jgi:hypothetical protein
MPYEDSMACSAGSTVKVKGKKICITRGEDNVFDDLGFDAEEAAQS